MEAALGLLRRRMLQGLCATLVTAGPALAARTSRIWPRGARAGVSLTYDDGAASQLDYAVPALDALGLKATFFLTGDSFHEKLPDWMRVAESGHEIADHSMTHPCSLRDYSTSEFRAREIRPLEGLLDKDFGHSRPRLYAYPCGVTHLGRGSQDRGRGRYVRALSGEITAARTIEGPPNDPRNVWRHRFRLNAFEPTYEQDETGPAVRYLNRAIDSGGWAILIFHGVSPDPSEEGDTSVGVHRAILEWIKAAPLWCAPMGEVFHHLASRQAATLRA
jgi:peptidoglycan/xylan/chitin deacetylase (PgdA/CDA1 family)